MSFFVDNKGTIDYEGLKVAQQLSATIGYRMATIELEIHEWNQVNVEDMLTGCSITGVTDFLNKASIDISTEKGKLKFIEILNMMREVAHKTVEDLSYELKRNKSKLITTVKPSGTISQLPTVSSGVHYSHAPYYIRRIRISAVDPLSQALVESGFKWSPEVGETEENHKIKVFEFPVKAPQGKTKYDVSVIEQLELYKLIMTHYVDHNASNTIHVRDGEWDDAKQWIYENWDDVVGVTFLSLDDNFYQLAPYETITEEQYEKMISEQPIFDSHILSKFENFEVEFDLGSDCDSGACPVR